MKKYADRLAEYEKRKKEIFNTAKTQKEAILKICKLIKELRI